MLRSDARNCDLNNFILMQLVSSLMDRNSYNVL